MNFDQLFEPRLELIQKETDIGSLRTSSDAPATFLRPLIIGYKIR
jgi:hypothetical protein